MTRETVAAETPARRATSEMVTAFMGSSGATAAVDVGAMSS
jgi:hypothetical protein